MNGGTIRGFKVGPDPDAKSLVGGVSFSGSNTHANGNSVEVYGGTLTGDIAGGWVDDTGDANSNTVTIKSTNPVHFTDTRIFGGSVAGIGNAIGNVVTLTSDGNPIEVGAIWAGTSLGDGDEHANKNEIHIDAAHGNITINGKIQGGFTAGTANEADAIGNIIDIRAEDGYKVTVNTDSIGEIAVIGGEATGHATKNVVTITGDVAITAGDTTGFSIIGGQTTADHDGDSASENTVILDGKGKQVSTNGSVVGGLADWKNNNVVANDNIVKITDATIEGDVIGGSVYYAAGETSRNEVTLSGNSTVSGNLIGGGGYDATFTGGTAKDNRVNIYGGTLKGSLYGGRVINGGTSSGNTLNLHTKFNVGRDLGFFQILNFYNAPTESAMLTVNSAANFNSFRVDETEIDGNAKALKKGDSMTLIEASTLNVTGSLEDADDREVTQGITLEYKGKYSVEGNKLVFTVTADPEVAEGTKALSEGLAANLATVLSGGDLISNVGMKQAFVPSFELNSYTFGGMAYGSAKYDTGSHVDSDTFAVLAGIARDTTFQSGTLTYGGFIEAGWADYDTYNRFTDFNANGTGDSNYYGLGLSLRIDHNGDEKGHFYNDAALRFGKAKNDVNLRFVPDDPNEPARTTDYETDSGYLGAHFGVGYLKNLNGGANLDLYTKLLWTRLNGDDVVLPTGDPISFDDIDSLRWRTGLRYAAAPRSGGRFYVGAAYEHEFSGDADATTYGLAIESPSLEGGTGIGEIGYLFQRDGSPFTADINLSGFTGEREGFGARVDLNWVF
jgi:hypothetical protein